MIRFPLSVLIAVLVPAQLIFSQPAFVLSEQLRKSLDSVALQDVRDQTPGIATAIVQGGNLIYEKYSGLADLTDSSAISSSTRFNIASNGKQFTALAVLTLSKEGKLSLRDDLRKYLPRLYPAVKHPITIAHLLNHSSGIRDVYDLWALQGYTWWKQSFNNQDALNLAEKQVELNFIPGTRYLYSNTNYILLTFIIEKVSGKSFVEYTRELFKKLGMPNTAFENDYTKIPGPLANAYFNFNTWTSYKWIWNVCGDGNIFSTLEDLIRWEKIINGKVISSISKDIIRESQRLVSPSVSNYGYGLEFGVYKGIKYAFHEGATGAWKATVVRFPGKGISMLTLTNSGKTIPSMQTRQMADVLFNLPADNNFYITRPEKAGKYVSDDELTGAYLTGDNFLFEFEKRNGILFLKRVGRNDVELEREADNIFHQKFDTAFKQEFVLNAKGEMSVTAYYINHAPYTLTREQADWGGYAFSALEGRFLNSETGSELTIVYEGDHNYKIFFSEEKSGKAVLVSPSRMIVNNYVLTVEKAEGGINTLYLDGNRIKRVRFNRQVK